MLRVAPDHVASEVRLAVWIEQRGNAIRYVTRSYGCLVDSTQSWCIF